MSAVSLTAGNALATAAEHSHNAQEGVVVLRIADADRVVHREIQLLQRGLEPGRLVDAGGQHHDRALVEDHLQLEAEIANGFEHGVFVRLPRRDDAAADRQRRDAARCAAPRRIAAAATRTSTRSSRDAGR